MRNKANGLIYVAVAAVLAAPAFSAGGMSGETIFKQKCKACHVVKGEGGKLGPELTKVSQKRDENYIVTKLKAPEKTNPDTVMPSFEDLSGDEFTSIVEYLKSLK